MMFGQFARELECTCSQSEPLRLPENVFGQVMLECSGDVIMPQVT